MKVFLSWSGQTSKAVAIALRNWLPDVLHYVKPWLSQQDIEAGDRWSVEVSKELNESEFGIICLTRENILAPWVLFEAGALSKSFTEGAVCPYLFYLEHTDVIGPLQQFQSKKSDYQSTKELVYSINSKAQVSIDNERLNKWYDKFWPDLESQLSKIPRDLDETPIIRTQAEVLEDLVQSVRSMEGRFREFAEKLSVHDSIIQPITKYYTDANRVAVVVHASDSVGKVKSGSIITVQTNPTRLFSTLCSKIGASPDNYIEDWSLIDQNTGKKVSIDEFPRLSDQYRGEVCFLTLKDENEIPF